VQLHVQAENHWTWLNFLEFCFSVQKYKICFSVGLGYAAPQRAAQRQLNE